MGSNLKGRQLIQLGTVRASGSHRCLHQALRTYWLTTLTAPQVGFNISVSGTLHFITVGLSLVPFAVRRLCAARLPGPLYLGQKAGD